MIILFHPRATKPRNCRLPLAVLALAAVLEGREEYRIIDGNLEEDPTAAILNTINVHQVELLGVSCMPGPQMVAAMETCREIRRLRPHVRIVWGGYFPSLYPDTTLNAKYVDYVVCYGQWRRDTASNFIRRACMESGHWSPSLDSATRTRSGFIAPTLSGR